MNVLPNRKNQIKDVLHQLHNKWEFLLLGIVLLGTLAVRVWQLETVPPGLHFDETIDLQQALNILEGARPIYISEGWGREALYYYLVAGMLLLVPSNVLALRLTAVFCSIALMGTSYLIARRFFNPVVALITVAWFSVNYWALFTSRFAARHIFLPLMLSVTIIVFWWAWWRQNKSNQQKLGRFLWAGFFFGATFYTYQPARFVPFIFLLFFLYLFLWHRAEFTRNWRGFLLFFGSGIVMAVPLIIILANNNVEIGSRAWLIEPLTNLLAGDPRLVWQNGIATLKMFTISGDPLVTYNIPGRPVFMPIWTGLFFYAGFALAIWRWKRPAVAFVLIWFFVMLAPTVLTASAPNYNRIIAAQTAVFIIAALPVAELMRWGAEKWGKIGLLSPALILLVAIAQTGWATWNDYFFEWQTQDELMLNYNGHVTALSLYLERADDDRPVMINSSFLDDTSPYIFSAVLDRTDLDVRWVDSSQAIPLPAGVAEARLMVTADRWVDEALAEYVGLSLQPEMQNEDFALYTLRRSHWPDGEDGKTAVFYLPTNALPTDALTVLVNKKLLPSASFENILHLEDISVPDRISAGQNLTFFTHWRISQRGDPGSLAFFVHMIDENSQLVAQQDGLGYPPHSWREGDEFVHIHHLQTAPDLPSGKYWIILGLYRRETGLRWQLMDEQRQPIGDRLLIGPIIVGES